MAKAIIETAKTKTVDGELYYIYPSTLTKAVLDENGKTLDEKLNEIGTSNKQIITASVPSSLWTEDGDKYVATISDLELNLDANYEVTFDVENISDEEYISLVSCFIVPDSYTSTTLTLKSLSEKPAYDFTIIISCK